MSLLSAAPVRVLPGLPIFFLGSQEGTFEPALGRMALVCGLVAHAVALLAVPGSAVVDRLVCGAIVGGLRTASGFIAFALVVSVRPVAVF